MKKFEEESLAEDLKKIKDELLDVNNNHLWKIRENNPLEYKQIRKIIRRSTDGLERLEDYLRG